jgi:hypothetical protein
MQHSANFASPVVKGPNFIEKLGRTEQIDKLSTTISILAIYGFEPKISHLFVTGGLQNGCKM